MESDNGTFMEKFTLLPSSSSAELPLTGLTFAVKDIFDVEGYVSGFGNPDWARTHPPSKSIPPVVSTLLRAGATCIGKTVMDEMAYSCVNYLNLSLKRVDIINYLIKPSGFPGDLVVPRN